MSLILLRHTKPLGADGVCYGRTDLALADGFAADLQRLLIDLPQFARIVTSPLLRCRRLAEAIGQERGQTVNIDDRLIEMDFGTWENRRWAEISHAEVEQWRSNFLHGKPHGGESVAELAARAQAAFDAASAGPVPALAVTHSGIIRAAMAATGDPEGWQATTEFGHWRRISWP